MATETQDHTGSTYDTSYSERSPSPSPSASPSLALNAPSSTFENRSISVASSFTSVSTSRSVSGDGAQRRRGYIRPQQTAFADSAKQRDSVMSLGTIAHLQYYFARTGLLDGKGAQLARGSKKKLRAPEMLGTRADNALNVASAVPTETGTIDEELDETVYTDSPTQSALDENGEDPDAFALPPTVSTYKHKSVYVPPPPNLTVLRRELREALADAHKLMDELKNEIVDDPINSPRKPKRTTTESDSSQAQQQDSQDDDTESSQQGWYELQGLRVLDIITLAIRAAKNYYTSHEEPSRLYAIRSERNIRGDLYAVLELLKKMAARNFAGGFRRTEHTRINNWVHSIENLVTKDEEVERAKHERRQSWVWQQPGVWEGRGRGREREWLFLKSFNTEPTPLPTWTDPRDPGASKDETGATPFLRELQNGLKLVRIHNEVVRASRRPFEEIKSYHLDTALPYRMAENLRYWIKSAELRWSTVLTPDVMGIVHASSPEAWHSFDDALMYWCRAVREELTNEWAEYSQALDRQRNHPVVAVPTDHDNDNLDPHASAPVTPPRSVSTPVPASVMAES